MTGKWESIQYKYNEILVSPNDMWYLLDDSEPYDDELVGARETLKERIRHHIANNLTDRQSFIARSWFYEGKTQDEIAYAAGIGQSAVNLAIHGVPQYAGKGKHIRYGGISQKLRKLLANDEAAQQAWGKIKASR